MSGYAGRHRDAVAPGAKGAQVAPVVGVGAVGRRRRWALLLVAGFAVVLAALSLVAYPTIAGRDGAATGPPSPTVPPEAGLQLLGRQGDLADLARQREEVGQGTSTAVAPTDPPTSASSTTAPSESPTSSAAATARWSAPAAVTGRAAGTPGGPAGTTPPASPRTSPSASTTPSPSTTTDSTRTAARGMLAGFGFADNEFGCLNAMWNRLGLWGTVAQARSGLAYIEARYGTPCAAWDHVRATGEY